MPGEHATKFWERFTIGPPECPLMHRLTIFSHRRLGSLRLHRFVANADDRDVHDHPWAFLTFVLAGYYDDCETCGSCNGSGVLVSSTATDCRWCGGVGYRVRETMSAGKLRYRPATHRHRTRVGPKGCLTVVLTGPVVRQWGFWRWGRWIPWREYEERYGYGMRCDEEGHASRRVSFARAHKRGGAR